MKDVTLSNYQEHLLNCFFRNEDGQLLEYLNNRLNTHNPKDRDLLYIVHILSRAINNPGDIKSHLEPNKSITLFLGDVYSEKVVNHYKTHIHKKIKFSGFTVCNQEDIYSKEM